MKVNAILSLETTIQEHTAKIRAIMEREVDTLSISELAFIKRVSAGSITTMKKAGASNEKILRTAQNHGMTTKEKVMMYLKSLSEEERRTLLNV